MTGAASLSIGQTAENVRSISITSALVGCLVWVFAFTGFLRFAFIVGFWFLRLLVAILGPPFSYKYLRWKSCRRAPGERRAGGFFILNMRAEIQTNENRGGRAKKVWSPRSGGYQINREKAGKKGRGNCVKIV